MKSYFAGSVQLAMQQARKELGSEAILVTSRLSPVEAGKPRQYEVVFATEEQEKGTLARVAQPATVAAVHARVPRESLPTTPPAPSIAAVLEEIKDIRRQIEALFPRQSAAPSGFTDAERQMLAHLRSAEVDPDLAQQLLASALEYQRSGPATEPSGEGRFAEVLRAAASRREPDLHSALASSIRDAFRVQTGFEDQTKQPALALIGPPGVGKTAALVKLAVRYGIGQGRQAILLSAGDLRIAASEQLRRYAAVLGLRFEHTASPRALAQLLEDHRNQGLILIDTPGFSARDISEAGPLAQFLASREDVMKHLVLPASARGADIDRIFRTYEMFHPTHLLFSRMDETSVFGPILNEAMGRGLPLSFFGTGASVPEDLTEASADLICEHLLPARTTSLSLGAAA